MSHEPLPMTINYKSKACVLQLDLANYTALTASCDALVLASHVQVYMHVYVVCVCLCSYIYVHTRIHIACGALVLASHVQLRACGHMLSICGRGARESPPRRIAPPCSTCPLGTMPVAGWRGRGSGGATAVGLWGECLGAGWRPLFQRPLAPAPCFSCHGLEIPSYVRLCPRYRCRAY